MKKIYLYIAILILTISIISYNYIDSLKKLKQISNKVNKTDIYTLTKQLRELKKSIFFYNNSKLNNLLKKLEQTEKKLNKLKNDYSYSKSDVEQLEILLKIYNIDKNSIFFSKHIKNFINPFNLKKAKLILKLKKELNSLITQYSMNYKKIYDIYYKLYEITSKSFYKKQYLKYKKRYSDISTVFNRYIKHELKYYNKFFAKQLLNKIQNKEIKENKKLKIAVIFKVKKCINCDYKYILQTFIKNRLKHILLNKNIEFIYLDSLDNKKYFAILNIEYFEEKGVYLRNGSKLYLSPKITLILNLKTLHDINSNYKKMIVTYTQKDKNNINFNDFELSIRENSIKYIANNLIKLVFYSLPGIYDYLNYILKNNINLFDNIFYKIGNSFDYKNININIIKTDLKINLQSYTIDKAFEVIARFDTDIRQYFAIYYLLKCNYKDEEKWIEILVKNFLFNYEYDKYFDKNIEILLKHKDKSKKILSDYIKTLKSSNYINKKITIIKQKFNN